MGGPVFHFPPFQLDLVSGQLRRGAEVLPLRPKSFAVLRYFVEHAGQLITKDALLDAVWPDTVVTEALVKDSIFELRKVLGDAAKEARVIETVHRRGYRFLPIVTTTSSEVSGSRFQGFRQNTEQLATRHQQRETLLVGREAELVQLHTWLDKALSGARQMVFVTGEPGIGKTTLVDVFLRPFAEQDLRIGRGQCIEQYGAGEAYMPMLEAFGQLCRAPGGERLIALLEQHAPTWLVQMPTLLSATAGEALQRKIQGVSRERMLRELGAALDILTAERPLVLWLEDLHWSDVATVELLALLARRREPARLLVIGTYRPVDVRLRTHPLRAVKEELHLHGLCEELPLGLLSEQHVVEYLQTRFDVEGGPPHAAPVSQLAHAIHERTEGNPLFIVTVVDTAMLQGSLGLAEGQWVPQEPVANMAAGMPKTLRQMIERQLEQLSAEDQRVVEVASVVGTSFSAAAVAAGAKAEIVAIERQCAALVQRGQLLQVSGLAEWPDGTIAARYEFLHSLYQEVMYEQVTASRRVELHRRIGERLEQAYGDRTREIATELAVHFEQGREYRKAVQ
jgi:predicted ATPase/DNA-binding winged helix-turn-helix (wHTH) protein